MGLDVDSQILSHNAILSHNSLLTFNINAEIARTSKSKGEKERLIQFHNEAVKTIFNYSDLIFYLSKNHNRIESCLAAAQDQRKANPETLATIFPLPNLIKSTTDEFLITLLNQITKEIRDRVIFINRLADKLTTNPTQLDFLAELVVNMTLLMDEEYLIRNYKDMFYFSYWAIYDQIGVKKVRNKDVNTYLHELVKDEIDRTKKLIQVFKKQANCEDQCVSKLLKELKKETVKNP
jgi:hypothetical protein